MGAIYRTSRNTRSRLGSIGCGLVVCYLYYTTWLLRPTLESVRLAKFMNAEDQSSPLRVKPSSFDWGKVEYEYPITELSRVSFSKFAHLPRVQYKFPAETFKEAQVREHRREQVRHTFQRDWEAYRKFAWMKDALMPVTGGYRDQFSGWAATLVDSLDTLWIMGMRAEFDEAVAAVAEIDFGNSTSDRVNTFETNIRYMGGLLSAYDLSSRPVLLAKARELGDLLYGAFNTANRMPVDFINFEQAKSGKGLIVEDSVVSASPGTLSLEMTRLSQVTGDPKYYTAMSGVMNLFFRNQNKTNIPGLWPKMVSMSEMDVTTGTSFTLAGCADSLYEYLPKMHGLLQGTEPIYDTMSRGFLNAANEHMLFRPMLPDANDVLIAGNVDAPQQGETHLDTESEHLGCYLGGAFALGGRLLNRPEDIEVGAKLTRGCMYTYRSMPSGVGPERWNMVACKSRNDCKWNDDIWEEEKKKRREWKQHLPKGFTTAKDPRYILRPEAIESVFILYRITGQQEFQDAAWDMFLAVRNATYTQYASGSVPDVTQPVDTSNNEDYMESFWLAETLKYFYLAFSPPDVISLDDYVLNTEAHPFLRPK
ncbi:putative Glycoside hydrolase family 47 protein [Seiridium unicorne]|uniref:alpha-1,2-Mannosidase n=1 Tax=Seiridium unicorne TaxID=138068 RepID=A0ABR2UG84_9PEZI